MMLYKYIIFFVFVFSCYFFFFFFFSSRRRHTRWNCDWNSDVCSSDLVATVMSNIGLELALRDAGIAIVRCPVGDKYVMEEMIRRNIALGGEQSGHVIFSDYLFTGDRSEERRVGKERRPRWLRADGEKN